MNFRLPVAKLLRLSLYKTVKFNFHYFGFRGLLRPVVLCGRNLYLRKLKGKVEVLSSCVGSVRLGFADVQVVDRRYNRSIWDNSGTVYFCGAAHVSAGAKIVNEGTIVFGNNIILNGDTTIVSKKGISFGDNCLISWGGLVMDTDFHPIYSRASGCRENNDEQIVVGEKVWIGCKATLLKGACLPNGTIVAANAVVTKAFEEKCTLIGGVNRVIKHDVIWDYE